VFIVHLGGLVLASALLLLIGGGSIASWRGVPWYALCAGLLGVVIVASISYAVPRLGLATTLTVTIASQLLSSPQEKVRSRDPPLICAHL